MIPRAHPLIATGTMGELSPGRWAAATALVVVMLADPSHAQQVGTPAAPGNVPSPARVRAMAQHARSIRVTVSGSPAAAGPVALIPEPILRYDDKARNIFDSTLWVWGPGGRPAAVLKVEDYPHRPVDSRWLYGIVSVSTDLITVDGDEGWQWSSTKPGLDPRELPGAPVPARTEVLRLSQMKQLARRFEVHEDGGLVRGRLQLRLMPRPVHRYADPASGLEDGAIFAFAYGTNPDLLLVLESSRQGDSVPAWRYGLARLGGGATSVNLDGHEVWAVAGANPPARRETYMNRRQRDRPEP